VGRIFQNSRRASSVTWVTTVVWTCYGRFHSSMRARRETDRSRMAYRSRHRRLGRAIRTINLESFCYAATISHAWKGSIITSTYRHFEDHLLGGLPGEDVELLNL